MEQKYTEIFLQAMDKEDRRKVNWSPETIFATSTA
jgi:hypothetical protein